MQTALGIEHTHAGRDGTNVHSPTIIWDGFYFDKDRSDIYEAMQAIHMTNHL